MSTLSARLGCGASGVSDVQSAPGAFPFNPLCILRWPDRCGDLDAVRLDDWLAGNADALTRSEVQGIVDSLLCGKVYQGGGGASEAWTLEVAKP